MNLNVDVRDSNDKHDEYSTIEDTSQIGKSYIRNDIIMDNYGGR